MAMSLYSNEDVQEMANRLGVPASEIVKLIRMYEGDTWCFLDALTGLMSEYDKKFIADQALVDLERRVREDEEGAPF